MAHARGTVFELLPVRFMAKVGIGDNGCWDWIGATTTAGYGHLQRGGRGEGTVLAHRYSYELFRGAIPEGMQIDHVCRNRRCVNPEHLEVVTPRENTLRGAAPNVALHLAGKCARGHDRTTHAVLRRGTNRVVYCKACRREDRAAARSLERAGSQ